MSRNVPERTCIACRKPQPQTELLRFVREPGGNLMVDYRHRLPGRGAYTCIDRECIAQALRRGAFARTFKVQVGVPELADLLRDIDMLLQQRILNLLGMARKSGVLVSGSNAVLQELGRPDARLLIVARDAAIGTAEKIMFKAQGYAVPCVRMFTKEQLGRAVGREERSHLIVTDEAFARNLSLELTRLRKLAGEN